MPAKIEIQDAFVSCRAARAATLDRLTAMGAGALVLASLHVGMALAPARGFALAAGSVALLLLAASAALLLPPARRELGELAKLHDAAGDLSALQFATRSRLALIAEVGFLCAFSGLSAMTFFASIFASSAAWTKVQFFSLGMLFAWVIVTLCLRASASGACDQMLADDDEEG